MLTVKKTKEPLLEYTSDDVMTKELHLKDIFIVDDDDVSNFITQDILESMHIADKVHVYGDARLALDAIRQLLDSQDDDSCRCPDVIFLDINMPGMDGFEFMEEYIHMTEGRELSVIVLFVTSSLSQIEKARAQNVSNVVAAYVEKPLTEEIIMTILSQHFD
jgi:CheY-like chemotaxis protein